MRMNDIKILLKRQANRVRRITMYFGIHISAVLSPGEIFKVLCFLDPFFDSRINIFALQTKMGPFFQDFVDFLFIIFYFAGLPNFTFYAKNIEWLTKLFLKNFRCKGYFMNGTKYRIESSFFGVSDLHKLCQIVATCVHNNQYMNLIISQINWGYA